MTQHFDSTLKSNLLSQTFTIEPSMNRNTSLLLMKSPEDSEIDALLTDMDIGGTFKAFHNADKIIIQELKAEQNLGLAFCSAFIHRIEAIDTSQITPGTSPLNVTNQIYLDIVNHPSVKPFLNENGRKRVRRQEQDVLRVISGVWDANTAVNVCTTEKLRNELQVMRNCADENTSNFAINMRAFSQTSRNEISMIIGTFPRSDNGRVVIQDKSTKANHIRGAYASLPKEDKLQHGYQAPEVLRSHDFSRFVRLTMFEPLNEKDEEEEEEVEGDVETCQQRSEEQNLNITDVTTGHHPGNMLICNADEEEQHQVLHQEQHEQEIVNKEEEQNLCNVMMSGTDEHQQDRDEHLLDTTSDSDERILAEQNHLLHQFVETTLRYGQQLQEKRSAVFMHSLCAVSNNGILTSADEQNLTIAVKEFNEIWHALQAHVNSDEHAMIKGISTVYAKAYKSTHNKEMTRARTIYNNVMSDVHVITVMETIAATAHSLHSPENAVGESSGTSNAAVTSLSSTSNPATTNNSSSAAPSAAAPSAATEVSLLPPTNVIADSRRVTTVPVQNAGSAQRRNAPAINNSSSSTAASTARVRANAVAHSDHFTTTDAQGAPTNVVAESRRVTTVPVQNAGSAQRRNAPAINNSSSSTAASTARVRANAVAHSDHFTATDAQGAVAYPEIIEIDLNIGSQELIEINSSCSDDNDAGEESTQNTYASYDSMMEEPDWEDVYTDTAVAAPAAPASAVPTTSALSSNVTCANNSSCAAPTTGLPPPTPRANITTAPTNVTPNVTTVNATAAASTSTASSSLKPEKIIIARKPADSLTIPHQNDLVPDFELINKITNWEISYLPSRMKPDPKTNQDVEAPPYLNISSIQKTLEQHSEFAEVFHAIYLSTCVPRRTLNLYMQATKRTKKKKRKLLRTTDGASAQASKKSKKNSQSSAPPQNEHLSSPN